MASFYSGYSNYYRLRLDVTQGTQSIANNTTSISWALYLENGTAYFELQSISGTYVNIDGSRAWTAGTNQISLPGYNSTTKLASGTKTVTHNADGTKTVPLYVHYTMPNSASYLPGNMSISASMTLTTIARTSTPTLNKSSVVAGETVRITTNRPSTAYMHNIKWRINGGSNWTIIATGVDNYWDWTPAVTSVCDALPNAISGVFNIMVETYNGSTHVGSKTINISISLPTSISPAIGNLSVEESSPFMMNTMKLGYFVAGVSRIKPSVSSKAAGQGATIKSEYWEMAGLTLVTDSFPAVNSTSMTVKYTLTDSRGRSSYKTLSVTQTAYAKPSINNFFVSRYNDANPNQVVFDLQAFGTVLIPTGASTNKNALRYQIEKKAIYATDWTVHKAYTGYNYSNGIKLTASAIANIPNDQKYKVRVLVQDRMGSTSSFEMTLSASDRLWLEVTDGEDINFIGNLKNNGVPIPRFFVKSLSHSVTNGAAIIPNSSIGVTTSEYMWWATVVYAGSSAGLLYCHLQPTAEGMNIYIRNNTTTKPPDGTYKFWLLGVKA